MNNKKKNRGGSARTQRQRSLVAEGVYSNPYFMHATTAQVGNIARITTAAGQVWEGVFKTYSQNFDVVMEMVAKVENPERADSKLVTETHRDRLIFKPADILCVTFKNVDLDYPIKDTFQTDTAISARLNGNKNSEEKELEPWDAGQINGTDGVDFDLEGSNGWNVQDMFKKNEQEYGVQSTFDHSLRGYTVPLQTSDSADYKEAQAKADQIANEIESQPAYKARLELENGDEEAAFASVVRPGQNQDSANGKYIPPAKRKGQNGKLVRNTPPPSSGSSSQNSPSPKENRPPLSYPPHPPVHQNNIPVASQPPSIVPQGPPPPLPVQPMVPHPTNVPPPATPPHQYQQRPPKPQMNGDIKMAPPRHQYQPPPQEIQKELQGFHQDFKLAPPHDMHSAATSPNAEVKQPSPAPSPQTSEGDKLQSAVAKSTLNPNAKEFVLNPSAKPFQPRSPSTPSASRPHTPQTPSHSPYIQVSGPSGPPMQVMMPMQYMISHPQYQPPPPQSNRIRKNFTVPMNQIRADMASQMQHAAAVTGQPLLAPAPIPAQFLYPGAAAAHNMNQAAAAAAAYQPMMAHTLRMYDTSAAGQPNQIQYLPQQPSGTASPAQAQYNPAAVQQQPGPPQGYQAMPPQQAPTQIPMFCIPQQPHLMTNVPYLQQAPPPGPPHPHVQSPNGRYLPANSNFWTM